MAEERHELPLAPPHIYRRSDEDHWPRRIYSKPRFPNRVSICSKCFVFFFTLLVLLCLALLVFALIVFRIDYPKLKLDSAQVKILKYATRADNLTSLNMTMGAEIKLSNSNFGGFKFQNGSMSVVHGNTTLGSVKIEGGLVRGRKVKTMNLEVQVRAQNINISSSSDDMGSSDLVKLNSYAQLRGEIRVLKHISTHRTPFMNCSMNLNLTSKAIQDLQCL